MFSFSDRQSLRGNALEYENKYWLVGGWLLNPVEKWMQPKRIISLETLSHQMNLGS